MTISSTIRKAGPFIGNGSTTSFPFAFKIFETSDLLVVLLDEATNTETTLVLNSNYTATMNGDQNGNPGGTVTLIAGALASGYTLTITSDLANLQPTDLTNQGGFYPDVINDALDRSTVQIQQLQEQTDRSLKIAVSSTANVTLPPESANQLLGWDATGQNLANIDPGTLATIVAYATAYADTFTGDGTTVNWVLSHDPAVLYNLDVSINGVTQVPTVDYTLAGTTFTTTTAAPTGAVILVKYSQALPNMSADSQDVRYLPPFTGSTSTTVEAKLAQTVSVKDFGAVGDGVTDDTAAIQAAINYCVSLNSDSPELLIDGTCLLTSSLILNRPTSTPSQSRGRFVIRGMSANAGFSMYGVDYMFENDISGYSENIVFENVWFQSDHSDNSGAGYTGVINGEKFIRVSFNNCYFQEIGVEPSCSIYIQSWYLTNCKFVSWNGPIINASALYDVNIIGCQFESGNYAGSTGITAYAASGPYISSQKVTAIGCLYENCTGPFITIQNGEGIVVQGNYFELNANQVLDFQQGYPQGVYVTGNSFDLGPLASNAAYAPIIVSRPNGFFGAGNYSNGTLYYFLNQMSDSGVSGGSWGHGDYTANNGRILSTNLGVNGGTKTPGFISSIRPDAYEVGMQFGVGYGASTGELHTKTTGATRIGWAAKQTNATSTYNNFSVKNDGTFAINLSTSGVTLDENATLAFFQASTSTLRIVVKNSSGVTKTADIPLV